MIYLLRHGLDDERYIGGHSDVDLIDEGEKQIEESALFIRDNLFVKEIISSDIKRSVSSSEIVRSYLDKDISFRLDSSLRELDKGILTGRKRSDLSCYEQAVLRFGSEDVDYCYPGGESMKDMYDRVNYLINSGYFIDKDSSLLVTHRGIINMIYFIFNDEKLTLNKEKFNVSHASVHEMDLEKRLIKRIF